MDAENTTYVILAGGSGKRLWPLSTEERPKQFLRLGGSRSLLQQAYDRIATATAGEHILVLTSARFVDACRTQLPELPRENIIGEPCRRDTAAAILLASLWAERKSADAQVVVLTSDHVISPADALLDDVRQAVALSREENAVVTFGIPPDRPATEFGYLELETKAKTARLKRFIEKPDREAAQAYIDAGTTLWNSGMFVFPAALMRGAFSRHLPDHLTTLSAVESFVDNKAFDDAFEKLTPISIDYGIMEKLDNVHAIRASFAWRDLGNFAAVGPILSEDDHQNRFQGQIYTEDARSNLIFCEDNEEHVALLGVDDLVVVRRGKTTLVMPKTRAADLKKLLAHVPEALLHEPNERSSS